ncbi:hypothetical protein M6B38_402480 [Iris pallida]|uniref:Secreted protein n=1 Tax=Iris pallida TaxID=29817 RepID=A0AAX6FTL7_IRIPA|nr:hypothetical protein M6B38_402480 [Iris pallida]
MYCSSVWCVWVVLCARVQIVCICLCGRVAWTSQLEGSSFQCSVVEPTYKLVEIFYLVLSVICIIFILVN